jgi:hypothetical protein
LLGALAGRDRHPREIAAKRDFAGGREDLHTRAGVDLMKHSYAKAVLKLNSRTPGV